MRDRKKLNCAEAKKLSIVYFLATSGYYPVKEIKNDCYYLSPFRIENNPSFRVNKVLNVYYDYGTGEGGTIIDLGTKLLNCSIEALLDKLSGINFSPVQPLIIYAESSINVKDTKNISSPALLAYINERAVNKSIAMQYCVEVSFEMNNKNYYAIGFENNSKGFELRNKYFKGSCSPKDISLIKNDSDKLCLFEGFFDFLSYFGSKFEMDGTFDFLILNSISFLERSIETIKNYKEVYLFLDNDVAGQSGVSKLLGLSLSLCINKSVEYKGCKDLNEYKIQSIKNEKKEVVKPIIKPFEFGM